jgi:hypothetical protein
MQLILGHRWSNAKVQVLLFYPVMPELFHHYD